MAACTGRSCRGAKLLRYLSQICANAAPAESGAAPGFRSVRRSRLLLSGQDDPQGEVCGVSLGGDRHGNRPDTTLLLAEGHWDRSLSRTGPRVVIRVVLSDDSFLAREGIARVLDAIEDIDLVAACGD